MWFSLSYALPKLPQLPQQGGGEASYLLSNPRVICSAHICEVIESKHRCRSCRGAVEAFGFGIWAAFWIWCDLKGAVCHLPLATAICHLTLQGIENWKWNWQMKVKKTTLTSFSWRWRRRHRRWLFAFLLGSALHFVCFADKSVIEAVQVFAEGTSSWGDHETMRLDLLSHSYSLNLPCPALSQILTCSATDSTDWGNRCSLALALTLKPISHIDALH